MPDIIVDVVLGLVQGVTEFLPVSSSGHLVVVPAVLGWEEPSVSFDLLLHVATLLAVLVYFRAELWQILLSLRGRGVDPEGSRRLLGLMVVATIPAAVLGLGFEDTFERLFGEPVWTAGFWVVTAVGLLVAERAFRGRAGGSLAALGVAGALVVGFAQAAALAPGISRSGATIVAGLGVGLSRTDAARFAFLVSIPAIAGGGLTLIPDIAEGSLELTGPVLAGFAVAAVSGYAAIAGLLRMVRAHSLAPFAVYLLVAAPAAVVALEVL